MKKLLHLLLCLPMIGLCQTDLTTLLFQLIDSKDSRNILENEGWRTNSVNNPTDAYDVNYNEFKLSKYINLSEGNSSRCYFTIKEYSTYSNIITLKIYDKSFYKQFEKIIINSDYKQISKDVKYNTIELIYKKNPLQITFKEELNNYYQITLLNYKHREQKAQTFTKAMLEVAVEVNEIEIDDPEPEKQEVIEEKKPEVNKNINWKNYKLNKENKQLVDKVNKGSVLEVGYILVQALKYRNSGKEVETAKASKVINIRTTFNIEYNPIAEKGPKTIYLRFLSPDKNLLVNTNRTQNFVAEKGELKYSISKQFQYENKELPFSIDFKRRDPLKEGEYIAEVYIDGFLAGTNKFYLK